MSSFPFRHELLLASLDDLHAFAIQFSTVVKPGDVIALNGPLGVGKTTFSQCFCKALGVTDVVSSPTYSLINDYQSGKFPVAHIDLYRLGEKSYQLEAEISERLDEGNTILLVEWACYAPFLTEWITVDVRLNFASESQVGQEPPRVLTVASGTAGFSLA